MRRLLIGYFLAVIGLMTTPLAAQSDAAGAARLQTLLSPDEFVRAGLTKLTPAELAALEAALTRHQVLPGPGRAPASVVPAPSAAPARSQKSARTTAADFGAEQVVTAHPADTPTELRSRIEGTLEELSGRAVFVLENGQVWQQRIPEAVHFTRKLVNPEVVISRGLGGYKMVIVPVDRVVFVKRIQ